MGYNYDLFNVNVYNLLDILKNNNACFWNNTAAIILQFLKNNVGL